MKSFILGMYEFRSDLTTSVVGKDETWYDRGRDLAHKITLRKLESHVS